MVNLYSCCTHWNDQAKLIATRLTGKHSLTMVAPTKMGVSEERKNYVLVISLNEYQVLLLLSTFEVVSEL